MKAEQIVYLVLFYVTVVGGANWALHVMGKNPIEMIENKNVKNSLYVFIALSALTVGGMKVYHMYKHGADKPKTE
jgi:hypothetical protein